MVSEISIKDNQIVTSKENGQTDGAGGGGGAIMIYISVKGGRLFEGGD